MNFSFWFALNTITMDPLPNNARGYFWGVQIEHPGEKCFQDNTFRLAFDGISRKFVKLTFVSITREFS